MVPVVQLATHAKSSTLHGRSHGRTVVRSYGRASKFFSAGWVTTILYNYGATLCELRYQYLSVLLVI